MCAVCHSFNEVEEFMFADRTPKCQHSTAMEEINNILHWLDEGSRSSS
jgi:hypothetical protein